MTGGSGIRNKGRTLFFAVVLFAVFILVLEVVLNTTHLFGARRSCSEPDPVLGWRFTPGRAYWYHRENDHPITGRINHGGWRDRDRSRARPTGSYRVAVIGDSFVEAIQVERDSTFVARVEDRLGIEVLNFGRSGMTQTEEWLLLQDEVAGYSPDLVVLLFVPVNDVSEVAPQTSDTGHRPFFDISQNGDLVLNTGFTATREYRLKAAVNGLKQHSALVSLVNQRYNLFRQGRRRSAMVTRDESQEGIGGTLSLCTARPDPVYARNYALNKRLIGEMAGYCNRQGIAFMLVCANWIYQTDRVAQYRKMDATFDPGFFERDLASHADTLGIEYLGLQEPFEHKYQMRQKPLHWQHWNYRGHRLVAELLARKIEPLLAGK